MKIDSSNFVSMIQDADSAKFEHVAITWQHRDATPIRKFKNGDQLRTSDGAFVFVEGTGWVKKESETDKFENTSHHVGWTAKLNMISELVRGTGNIKINQKEVGEPPTFARLLRLPDDSLYLYIGQDDDGDAHFAGCTIIEDIMSSEIGLGSLRDEHVCACKCEGHCKNADKSEKDKKNNVLAGTVDGMLSDDYKERFIAEYVQLSERLARMNTFIKTNWSMCDCDINLFIQQLQAMVNYRAILKRRAVIEKIDLPKCVGTKGLPVPTIRFM